MYIIRSKKGKNSFEGLNNKKEVENYFKRLFPDFFKMVPNLYEQCKTNPTSNLELLELTHAHIGNSTLLIGDSLLQLFRFMVKV